MGLSRRQARAQGLEILTWIGLDDKAETIAGTLPYTDERRVGIARALMMKPAFVLLDEPAAGMSDLECDHLMETIAQIPPRFGAGVFAHRAQYAKSLWASARGFMCLMAAEPSPKARRAKSKPMRR